jgi:Protein of unknown function (DUF4245)
VAARTRGRETVGDMVRSLGLVVGVVLVLAVVVAVALPDGEPVPEFDYAEAVEGARQQVAYELVAPDELPDGWRVTSARVRPTPDGTVWSLGLVTRSGDFVGLEQTDADPRRVEREQLQDYEPDGTTAVDGAEWERWVERARSPDRALRRDLDGTTVVVVGTSGYEVIEDFVRRLEPVR